MDMDNQNTKIYTDKVLAVTSLLFVFISVAGLAIYSQESIKIAATWMQWTTSVFTTPVLLFAFLAIIFTFGLAFSKYGKIKLGEGKPQYTTMSWIFMFILSGIGSSTLYWGFLDWAYYYQTPGLSLPPESIYGDVIPTVNNQQRFIISKEPVGVVAAITPWNFPIAMITRKAAPALAAGCTVVIKPANETPYCALAIAKLAEKAGIPAGVINVVTGKSQEIGSVFTSHEKVKKLTFTGSTPVGRLLMQQCSSTIKKLALELGGNAPLIVFDDADLDKAVQGAIFAKFRNAGQTCVCANRIYVHDNIYQAFAEKFVQEVQKFKVGNGLEDGVQIGPLINEKAVLKAQQLIDDSVSKGAKVACGGKQHVLGQTFYEPSVLTNVDRTMEIVQEEIFGPVAPLIRFTDEADVVAQANDTIFGLAAYVYSENISRLWRVSEQLEYGMVGMNATAISNEVVPFGGVKQSGVGREGSKYGLEEFMTIKYMCLGL
ncbi:NAD-dependent succinate-semialdehyde dehydrogenase [Acinetobacter pittii]